MDETLGMLVGAGLLVLARAGGLALAAPAWSQPALGYRVRVALGVLLTLVLTPLVRARLSVPGTTMELAAACAVEAAVGLALGLVLALVVAAARQAGELVGLQAGLAPASLLDPEALDGGEPNPLAHLYGLVALGVFLACDGPLRLVDALAASYEAIPAGGSSLSEATVAAAFRQVSGALALALQAAAPAALAVLVAGLALGILTRSASGLQLLSLSLPVRAVAGIGCALIGLAALAARFHEVWQALLPP
jgi:flagellar biosynthetic protein FliR